MTDAGPRDLAAAFEASRGRLRTIAYRMLGSLSDADDAVQETWLRLSRSDADDLANLGGWLTTVISPICLDMLRSRSARHEEPLGEHLPDPVVSSLDRADPEQEAELPEPMDAQHFTGPHPTCREFVAQLTVWGFTQRGEERAHTIFRGPRGGTLRVIRSQLGRADPALVDKAARLAAVTPAQFWSGPQPQATSALPPEPARARRTSRRKPAARDSIISLVLAIHAEADRPLGFDQVVELSGNRATRAQVSTASATLCRDGQLGRIRPGVYQWSMGQRVAARRIPAARRAAGPLSWEAPLPRRRPGPQPGRQGPCRRRSCSASSSHPASR
jgi:hypothetical protein